MQGCPCTNACLAAHRLSLQGTCTPLHADVLRSHSWSANVAGRKRWRLLPPQVGRRCFGEAGAACAD